MVTGDFVCGVPYTALDDFSLRLLNSVGKDAIALFVPSVKVPVENIANINVLKLLVSVVTDLFHGAFLYCRGKRCQAYRRKDDKVHLWHVVTFVGGIAFSSSNWHFV